MLGTSKQPNSHHAQLPKLPYSRETGQWGELCHNVSWRKHTFPIEKHEGAMLALQNKGPNAEARPPAHPPFALGRVVHFCHSILQHVNICPGRSPARAGLVVPTASCFRIHACRLCFFFTILCSHSLSSSRLQAECGTHPLIYRLHLHLSVANVSFIMGPPLCRGWHYKHRHWSHGG